MCALVRRYVDKSSNFRDRARERSIVFIQMETSLSPPVIIQYSCSQIAAHATHHACISQELCNYRERGTPAPGVRIEISSTKRAAEPTDEKPRALPFRLIRISFSTLRSKNNANVRESPHLWTFKNEKLSWQFSYLQPYLGRKTEIYAIVFSIYETRAVNKLIW